ncbi:MAG: ComEC/Rec2 family competence protein [Candidatus Paceibacterota bacterium]|jgi:competence protein ComEC
MKGPLFYSLSVAFFAGVFFASRPGFGFSAYVCVGIVALAALAFLSFGDRRTLLSLAIGVVCSFACGAVRSSVAGVHEHVFDKAVGSSLSAIGLVCAEPEGKEVTQRFCFQPDGSADRVMVSSDRYPEYRYGDRLNITATIEFPENFLTYEGGPEFDYVSYLAKDDIRYVMKKPRIRIIERGQGKWVVAALIAIKGSFMENIERVMPEPHASLVAGLLLGEKGSLPQDVTDDFRRSGLTHILVLSGSNVSVIAENLMRIFSFLPRALGQASGASSIVLFALMTGASSTTVRASIMALVVILARGIGRRYDVVRALTCAAVIMIVQNPRILAFDIGFQLSFLATLALIFVSPIVTGWLRFVPERLGLREILVTTVATQIFTLPFILHAMGEISVISLVTNVLVLPCVSWAMLGGFMVGAFGFMHQAASLPAAFATSALISYMLSVVGFFGSLPFAAIRLSVGEPVLVAVYSFYVFFIWRWRRKNSSRQSAS